MTKFQTKQNLKWKLKPIGQLEIEIETVFDSAGSKQWIVRFRAIWAEGSYMGGSYKRGVVIVTQGHFKMSRNLPLDVRSRDVYIGIVPLHSLYIIWDKSEKTTRG